MAPSPSQCPARRTAYIFHKSPVRDNYALHEHGILVFERSSQKPISFNFTIMYPAV